MRPAKLNFLKIMSCLHITAILVQAAIIFYNKLTSPYETEIDWLFYLTMIPGNAILLTNSSIVLYLAEKCYPDKYPGRRLHKFSRIIFIISILLLAAVIFLTCIMFLEIFLDRPETYADNIDVLLFIVYSALSITGFIIIIQLPGLWNIIRYNYQSAIDSFMNSGKG